MTDAGAGFIKPWGDCISCVIPAASIVTFNPLAPNLGGIEKGEKT